jgi:hypothetical protein
VTSKKCTAKSMTAKSIRESHEAKLKN